MKCGAPSSGGQTRVALATQGVLALCDQARRTARPERHRVISQIFALSLDRCRPTALDAVELLIYELITNEPE